VNLYQLITITTLSIASTSIKAEVPIVSIPLIAEGTHTNPDPIDEQDWHPLIDGLKRLFDPLDKEAVAQQIHYPIIIKYPLEIRNEAELLDHSLPLYCIYISSLLKKSKPHGA
jgi:hypothetical protein